MEVAEEGEEVEEGHLEGMELFSFLSSSSTTTPILPLWLPSCTGEMNMCVYCFLFSREVKHS